ncbi:MAG: isopentenyl-diphosphate Delta-isomerase [Phycisphaerae bacterium]
MNDRDEYVILVDKDDRDIGTMAKLEAHENGGHLHRAFSVFLFNGENQLLLQRRARSKYHFGGLWTNSCCGHPRPGETVIQAATRRTREELGLDVPTLSSCFQHMYEASDASSGLTEREIDHVLVGHLDDANSSTIPFVPDEIEAVRWQALPELQADVTQDVSQFTPWFVEILPKFVAHVGGNTLS